MTLFWTERFPVTVPPARRAHMLAYHPDFANVVMFGGEYDSIPNYDDTWLWDGINWTDAAPADHPTARVDAMIGYHAGSGKVVLYGGFTALAWSEGGTAPPFSAPAVASMRETWTWDGSDWTLESPSTSPPPLTGGVMAYHTGTDKLVLFGGCNPTIGYPSTATWTWDGSDWTLETPATSPTDFSAEACANVSVTMAEDSVNGTLVLYLNILGVVSTWLWDGTDWSDAAPGTEPSAGSWKSQAFDPNLQQVIVEGYQDQITYAWDGSDWYEPSLAGSGPNASDIFSMAGFPDAVHTVQFGGTLDSSFGVDTTFVLENVPEPTTDPATDFACGMATLNGTITSNGTFGWFFEWGTTTGYGNVTTGGTVTGDNVALAVSDMILSGLMIGTTYHFRLVVGDVPGSDRSFVEAECPTPNTPAFNNVFPIF